MMLTSRRGLWRRGGRGRRLAATSGSRPKLEYSSGGPSLLFTHPSPGRNVPLTFFLFSYSQPINPEEQPPPPNPEL